MNTLIAFARQHILLFGAAKFLAGLAIGFALGIYTLPILTAETGLSTTELVQLKANAQETIRTGEFSRQKNPARIFCIGGRDHSRDRQPDLAGWRSGTWPGLPALSDQDAGFFKTGISGHQG